MSTNGFHMNSNNVLGDGRRINLLEVLHRCRRLLALCRLFVDVVELLVGLFVLFYFIAIRPQRKRQKEHAAMVAALAKGDEVVTSSGILGKISALDDSYVVLSVANNVDLKFQRVHIHAVLPKGTLKSISS